MTSKEKSSGKPPKDVDDAEKTRELIREFVETPPAKTMADVKAASDVYEANAQDKDPGQNKNREQGKDPGRDSQTKEPRT